MTDSASGRSKPPVNDDSLIDRTIGGYHILQKVGQGGMTNVYRASHVASGDVVAVKVLSPYVAQDPSFRERFRREVALLEGLRHPHIVPVLDYGDAEPYAFIVMPYMNGGTLQDRLHRRWPEPQEVARLMRQLCSALDHAHQRGIVHRDVKPSNILMDDAGRALLSDFGFAHIRDASLSLTGSLLIGTPAFMSPEQCRGEPVDARSDVYSLGVILFQLMTGSLPYEGDTPMAVVVKHIHEPLPRPRRVKSDLPVPVEAVLLKALEKKPDLRYPSIVAFNDGIQEAIEASYDEHGQPLPGAVGMQSDTWAQEPLEEEGRITARLRRPASLRGRLSQWALAAALLLLFAGPLGAWAMSTFMQGEGAASTQPVGSVDPSAQLLATINALSTANAPRPGTVVAPGEVETAVAATLAAMVTPLEEAAAKRGSDALARGIDPTPPKSGGGTGSTATSTGGGPPTSVPGGIGEGTSPPAPAASSTSTPTGAPPPMATVSPAPPSATFSTPPPSGTPAPSSTPQATIDPNKCKPPSHPVHGCTPTPSG